MLPDDMAAVTEMYTSVGANAGPTEVITVQPAFAKVALDSTIIVDSCIRKEGDRTAAKIAPMSW